ncbi:BAG family molecular chaperone regulator 6-like protein, partial [Tanacetum coccineum]
MKVYMQVHTEEGPVLDSAGLPLAVVKGIARQIRIKMKQFQATSEEGSMKECGDGDINKRCCHKGMVEVMEKLKSDNTNMRKLMKQISERNQMQTRTINSLSKRVEHLEKAFMTDIKSQ